MVTSRRLTRKTWASRQNYRAELLAIGKDSNGIRVRSSCLGFHKGEERIQDVDGAILTRESSQLRNETEANKRSNRKGANNTVNTQSLTWHTMHKQVWCMSGLNMHGMAKVHKQHYKLSGAQYATSCILTKHHIYYLVDSRLFTRQD